MAKENNKTRAESKITEGGDGREHQKTEMLERWEQMIQQEVILRKIIASALAHAIGWCINHALRRVDGQVPSAKLEQATSQAQVKARSHELNAS